MGGLGDKLTIVAIRDGNPRFLDMPERGAPLPRVQIPDGAGRNVVFLIGNAAAYIAGAMQDKWN